MAITIKSFVVQMAFEDDQPEDAPKPYIKQWWAEGQLTKAIEKHLPHQNEALSGVTATIKNVQSLSEFTSDFRAKLEDAYD